MATISRANWRAHTDWALVCRRIHARNEYNWARQQVAWRRRREVYDLWYDWREKYGGHRGLQTLIAAHLGVHKSTICRDFAYLGLRPRDCGSDVRGVSADPLYGFGHIILQKTSHQHTAVDIFTYDRLPMSAMMR